MKQLLHNAEIALLKRSARSSYIAYYTELYNYDCGIAMAESLSSRLREHKEAFNSAMEKLAEIDPTCPTQKL